MYSSVNWTSLVQTTTWRLVPSHYLNHCWNIVTWTLRNKFQWNLNRTSCIFMHENTFGNVVRKIVIILSRSQCVKKPNHGYKGGWNGFDYWYYYMVMSRYSICQVLSNQKLPRTGIYEIYDRFWAEASYVNMKKYRAISLRKLEIKISGMYGSFSVFKAPTPLLG